MKKIDIDKLKNVSPYELIEMAGIDGPPFDPYIIAEKIGINVKDDLDWEKLPYDGEIYLNDDGLPEIWINPTDHINRKRFTLAHEIGHLSRDVAPNIENFKDPIKDDYTTLRRGATRDLKEITANKFAAGLLMPKKYILNIGAEIVEQYQKEHNGEKIPVELFISIMAKKFEVSEQAMEYRLKNLGIIK